MTLQIHKTLGSVDIITCIPEPPKPSSLALHFGTDKIFTNNKVIICYIFNIQIKQEI